MSPSPRKTSKLKKIIWGLSLIFILLYIIASFLTEHEIANPTSKTLKTRTALTEKTASFKTSFSSAQKKSLSEEYRAKEYKRKASGPPSYKGPPGVTESELQEARRTADSIFDYKNLKEDIKKETLNRIERDKKMKRAYYRYLKMRQGFPDPFLKKKKKRKKTPEEKMRDTYSDYLKDKRKSLMNEYEGRDEITNPPTTIDDLIMDKSKTEKLLKSLSKER
ncbi:MAG: hypothetical protein ACE5GM_06465 [bacterium]